MKMLKPVSNVPNTETHRRSKYVEIWNRLKSLKNGDWLPVEFETKKQAYNFYLSAKTHRTLSFDVHSRLNTIYIRTKQDAK